MPRKTSLYEIRDFSGGINYRTDHFQLWDSESPDALNVDMDPRGGVRVRNGQLVDPTFTARTGALNLDFVMPWSALDSVVGFNAGNTVLFRPSAAAVSSTTVTGVTDACEAHHAGVPETRFYMMRGSAVVGAGDPTTPVLVLQGAFAFSNNLAAPTSAGTVAGHTCATHLSRLFVGRCVESAVEKSNRLRWSHPGRPEDFRQIDFIDVGDASEKITALFPFGDHLVIFTDRSMYGLFGDDPTSSSTTLRPISRVVGVASPRQVAASPGRLYFWSESEGVFSYDGSRIEYLFDKLRPAILTGRMEESMAGQMGWADGKLYVPITIDQTHKTLVLDPTLGRMGGSWTLYDLPMKGITSHAAVDGDVGLIFSRPNDVTDTRLYTLSETKYDDTINGVLTAIKAHYHTRWFDVKFPAAEKRWRRPRIVITSTAPQSVTMDVFHDYNFADMVKRLFVDTVARVDQALWGSFNWGEANWQGSGLMYDFDRTPRLGRSNAVQLRFSATSSNRWSVDSCTFVYELKKVR